MIDRLLRALGIRLTDVSEPARPNGGCCPEAPAERRLDQAQREAERTIQRADRATERIKPDLARALLLARDGGGEQR